MVKYSTFDLYDCSDLPMWGLMQVLGIPWDVDTDGLREYMSKFGELDDCIVMKVLRLILWHHFFVLSYCHCLI